LSARGADAVVTVCIDFRNPKAYLAKDPTFALEDELKLTFDWQPVRVSPLARPAPARNDDDRGTRHRRLRAQYHERDLRRYAERAGLPLGDIYRSPDASVAGAGLLWTKAQSHAIARRYIDVVFTRYWSEELDIEDASAIAAVLREIGGGDAGWDQYVTAAGRSALADVQRRFSDAGVFEVPAYLIDGDVYFGRQHLPMIRWILTGRVGTPPL
jgi:2-hydroxychromene-2-carboxylate isomerase